METEILHKSLMLLNDFDFLIFFYGFLAILVLMVLGIQKFEQLRSKKKLHQFWPTGPHLQIRVLRSPLILIWVGVLILGGGALIWLGGKDLNDKLTFYQQALLVREAPLSVSKEVRGQGKGRHTIYIGRFQIKYEGKQFLTTLETNRRLRKGKLARFLWSPQRPEKSLSFSIWSLFRLSATGLPVGFGLVFWGFGMLLKWSRDNEIRRTWKKMEVVVQKYDYRAVKGGFLLNAFFEFSHPRGGSLSAGLFAVVVGERREDLSQLWVLWDPSDKQEVAIESRPQLFGLFTEDRQKS